MSEQINKIKYHPGFVGGMELLFWSYQNELDFEPEYNLSKEPLRVDLLVLKKVKNIEINFDIARVFRNYNVIEYKSPDDELSVDEFYKTIGYALFYKSLGKTVNERPINEMTASIFRHAYPRELFRTLQEEGAVVEKKYNGVYYITRVVNFPVQIIVTRELDKEVYAALRVLTPGADEQDVRDFIEQAQKNTDAGYRRNADAVFQVSVAANRDLYESLRKEPEMCDALRELMKDELLAERTNAAISAAIEAYRDMGLRDREITAKIMARYHLSEKQAEEYVLAPQMA